MILLVRTLVLVFPFLLAIPMLPAADALEETVPAPVETGPRETGPRERGNSAGGDRLENMQEEIRLRGELARKIREGAPEAELAALRAEIDRLEKGSAVAGGAPPDDEAASSDVGAARAGAARDHEWWPWVESFCLTYRSALIAVAAAIVLRLLAGRSIRRRLASSQARVPRREGIEDDPRWHEAERCLVLGSSFAILAGLLAVLAIEAGLLSGTAVAILLTLGLALLWIFRRIVEDAVCGLSLLCSGSYQVGDMVDLDDRSGVVETTSLRATTLRDRDGSVHFVPHRLVRGVRNSTYQWARAVIDVPVKPDEDVDRIMGLLLEVAREMAQSPPFSGMILEEPRMLGVESAEASRIVIRFFVKTAPRSRSLVRRELQRRVLQRFRERGVEPPLPAQRLHHKIEKPSGE